MESSTDEVEFLEGSILLLCNFGLVVIFCCGTTANLLALLVFYRKPGLRTTANRFVINLMIINIVSCLSLLPISFTNNTLFNVNNYLCFAERFSSVFCSSAIVYSILLIAVDQYFAVVNPLHYHCIISSWKGYLMIVATWILSVGLALLSVVKPGVGFYRGPSLAGCVLRGVDDITFDEGVNSSEVSPNEPTGNFYQVIFGIAYASTAFLIPFGLIFFIYYSICVAASGNSKRARTSILTNGDAPQASESKCRTTGETMTGDGGFHTPVSVTTADNDDAGLSVKPSFVVTRPSPPKPSRVGEVEGDPASVKRQVGNDDREPEVAKPHNSKSNSQDERNSPGKVESEVVLLKPTLKNSSSFTKLSSLHIQFSNSTEKIVGDGGGERRHSNILLGTVDPEFENITKTRSSSMQSSFYELSSRSSFSTRSTTASTHIQSSRSSSLNSTYARLPPSRASSIRSTSSYIVHNIRHRISNASFFRYREEARAARISAMVIVMALFCWLPFFTVVAVYSTECIDKFPRFPYYLNSFSLVLLLSSTVASPFLFAFRNRQIKKEIRKIFQFCPGFPFDCRKSFYANNFTLTMRSQSVQLLTELRKGTSPKPGVTQTAPLG
ncbi:hypothetical protein RUM44_008092 [Polyplax serrata]|uniref:G-protein coupled receptors family 1 profile domain-containing protein n=1 Tax=Polyplax serrata TaxID=468196 RepID=A0ABR1B7P6_POLSC